MFLLRYPPFDFATFFRGGKIFIFFLVHLNPFFAGYFKTTTFCKMFEHLHFFHTPFHPPPIVQCWTGSRDNIVKWGGRGGSVQTTFAKVVGEALFWIWMIAAISGRVRVIFKHSFPCLGDDITKGFSCSRLLAWLRGVTFALNSRLWYCLCLWHCLRGLLLRA